MAGGLTIQDADSLLNIAKQQYIFDYCFKQNLKHPNCTFNEKRWIKDLSAMFTDDLFVMDKSTMEKIGTMLAPETLDKYFIFNQTKNYI